MSNNLPHFAVMNLTKGKWEDVVFPAQLVVQVHLTPRDYFEEVAEDTPRSCVPCGGTGFSYLIDANTGRSKLIGKSMVPPMSATFHITDVWNYAFDGRVMQLQHEVTGNDHVCSLIHHTSQTLPLLFTITTGLAVFCQMAEFSLNDVVEGRAETFLPEVGIKIVAPDERINELKAGIEAIAIPMQSLRFALACSYFREAIFLNSSYYEHNPYSHALSVILKCSNAIEVLFGSRRDDIRTQCRRIGISNEVIETEVVTFIIARNSLGSAHASGFVPNPNEARVLRKFAGRAVESVRHILLLITQLPPTERKGVLRPLDEDAQKPEFVKRLEEIVATKAQWTNDRVREWKFNDPRLQ